jgi:2-oxoglutarate ferredoxin oxidoreductase subunit delta
MRNDKCPPAESVLKEASLLSERRRVKLAKSLCKGCGYCVEFCPRKVFEESDETNEKGVRLPRIARPEDCTLCGLCTRLCPDFALTMAEEETEGG